MEVLHHIKLSYESHKIIETQTRRVVNFSAGTKLYISISVLSLPAVLPHCGFSQHHIEPQTVQQLHPMMHPSEPVNLGHR